MSVYRVPGIKAEKSISMTTRIKDWYYLNKGTILHVCNIFLVIAAVSIAIVSAAMVGVRIADKNAAHRAAMASRLLNVPASVIGCPSGGGQQIYFRGVEHIQCKYLRDNRVVYSDVYCSNDECLRR